MRTYTTSKAVFRIAKDIILALNLPYLKETGGTKTSVKFTSISNEECITLGHELVSQMGIRDIHLEVRTTQYGWHQGTHIMLQGSRLEEISPKELTNFLSNPQDPKRVRFKNGLEACIKDMYEKHRKAIADRQQAISKVTDLLTKAGFELTQIRPEAISYYGSRQESGNWFSGTGLRWTLWRKEGEIISLVMREGKDYLEAHLDDVPLDLVQGTLIPKDIITAIEPTMKLGSDDSRISLGVLGGKLVFTLEKVEGTWYCSILHKVLDSEGDIQNLISIAVGLHI